MDIAAWVLQVLMCAMFMYHAYIMLAPDEQKLRQQRMTYVIEMPAALRAFAGVAEGLAGVGLIMP